MSDIRYHIVTDIKNLPETWTPNVGDRQQVIIEVDTAGTLSIAAPEVTRPVEIRGDLNVGSDVRIEAIIEVVDTTGLTGVVADVIQTSDRGGSEEATAEPSRWELIEDVRRVAADVGRPPTLDHIAVHGIYDPEDYDAEFDSYVIALEEAGIEPTQAQYNFADYDAPADKQATANVRYLREHGPTPTSDLPSDTGRQDKRHGAWGFTIDQGVAGSPTSVYYLKDDHDERDVVRTFLEANPAVLANNSQRTLVELAGDHGQAFGDAMKRILEAEINQFNDED